MLRGLAFALLCGLILIFSAPLGRADGGAPPPGGDNASGSSNPGGTTTASSGAVDNPLLFIDVPADHWAMEDLKFLVENGIITGLPNGTFNGGKPLTRYSAATLVSRAIHFVLNNPTQVSADDLNALQELVFQVSDQVEKNQAQLQALGQPASPAGTAGGPDPQLSARLTQAEQTIRSLQTELDRLGRKLDSAPAQADSAQLSQLKKRVNANFIIGIAGVFVGIIGVALATMT